MPARLLPGA